MTTDKDSKVPGNDRVSEMKKGFFMALGDEPCRPSSVSYIIGYKRGQRIRKIKILGR